MRTSTANIHSVLRAKYAFYFLKVHNFLTAIASYFKERKINAANLNI